MYVILEKKFLLIFITLLSQVRLVDVGPYMPVLTHFVLFFFSFYFLFCSFTLLCIVLYCVVLPEWRINSIIIIIIIIHIVTIIIIIVWLVRCWTLSFLRACSRLRDSAMDDRPLPDQC